MRRRAKVVKVILTAPCVKCEIVVPQRQQSVLLGTAISTYDGTRLDDVRDVFRCTIFIANFTDIFNVFNVTARRACSVQSLLVACLPTTSVPAGCCFMA